MNFGDAAPPGGGARPVHFIPPTKEHRMWYVVGAFVAVLVVLHFLFPGEGR